MHNIKKYTNGHKTVFLHQKVTFQNSFHLLQWTILFLATHFYVQSTFKKRVTLQIVSSSTEFSAIKCQENLIIGQWMVAVVHGFVQYHHIVLLTHLIFFKIHPTSRLIIAGEIVVNSTVHGNNNFLDGCSSAIKAISR